MNDYTYIYIYYHSIIICSSSIFSALVLAHRAFVKPTHLIPAYARIQCFLQLVKPHTIFIFGLTIEAIFCWVGLFYLKN